MYSGFLEDYKILNLSNNEVKDFKDFGYIKSQFSSNIRLSKDGLASYLILGNAVGNTHFLKGFKHIIEENNTTTFDEKTLVDKNLNEETLVKLTQEIIILNLKKKISKYRKNYLLVSGGKDSLFIYDALSQTELIKYITPVHIRSNIKDLDETKWLKKVIGSKEILFFDEKDLIDKNQTINYLKNSVYPNFDWVQGVYAPLSKIIEKNSLIIDGMGNDVYIGHIPPKNENRNLLFGYWFDIIFKYLNLENKIPNVLFRRFPKKRHESIGLYGFNNIPNYKNIKHEIQKLNYFQIKSAIDYRAKVRGGVLDTYTFMGKTIEFAFNTRSEVSFPWNDKRISKLFKFFNKSYFYTNKKNKIFIRNYLTKKYNIDFFNQPKFGFSVDLFNIIYEDDINLVFQYLDNFFKTDSYFSNISNYIRKNIYSLKNQINGTYHQNISKIIYVRAKILFLWINQRKK